MNWERSKISEHGNSKSVTYAHVHRDGEEHWFREEDPEWPDKSVLDSLPEAEMFMFEWSPVSFITCLFP